MHKVERKDLPPGIKNQLDKHKMKLKEKLAALPDDENEKKKAVKKAWKGMSKERLKKFLIDDIFKGCCCYCEGDVTSVDYGDIDHRLPKSKYHNKTFEWENLFFACGKCNTPKGDQSDSDNPVIDICKEDPNQHCFLLGGHFLKARTKRGENTIEFCDLNREPLHERRKEVYMDLLILINSLRKNTDNNKEVKDRILKKAKHGSPFCSIYRHLIRKNIDIFQNQITS
jgi:uncharacterized protein (TIGR02646 family)